MVKNIVNILLFTVFFLFFFQGGAQSPSEKVLRAVPNVAFGVGEELYYKVRYGFITAGKAAFIIQPSLVPCGNGAQCYDVRFYVRSLESLDWLYRVRDYYRTLIDVHGIFPWKFEQHIREGRYRRDFTASFDQEKGIAYVADTHYRIPPFVHDIVSAFYYVRTLDLKKMDSGDTVHLQNFYKDSVYQLKVVVLKREVVSVEAGVFRTILIKPLVQEGGLFRSEGEILIWLSDDERKIPVKVETEVLIGSIDAELVYYRGLRGPLLARIDRQNEKGRK